MRSFKISLKFELTDIINKIIILFILFYSSESIYPLLMNAKYKLSLYQMIALIIIDFYFRIPLTFRKNIDED